MSWYSQYKEKYGEEAARAEMKRRRGLAKGHSGGLSYVDEARRKLIMEKVRSGRKINDTGKSTPTNNL